MVAITVSAPQAALLAIIVTVYVPAVAYVCDTSCEVDVVPPRALKLAVAGLAVAEPAFTCPLKEIGSAAAALVDVICSAVFNETSVVPAGGLRRNTIVQVALGNTEGGQLFVTLHWLGFEMIEPTSPVTVPVPVLVIVTVCAALGTPVNVVKLSGPGGETL